ncbi:hypothetical protein [Streptomyces sp. NPDC050485]
MLLDLIDTGRITAAQAHAAFTPVLSDLGDARRPGERMQRSMP